MEFISGFFDIFFFQLHYISLCYPSQRIPARKEIRNSQWKTFDFHLECWSECSPVVKLISHILCMCKICDTNKPWERENSIKTWQKKKRIEDQHHHQVLEWEKGTRPSRTLDSIDNKIHKKISNISSFYDGFVLALHLTVSAGAQHGHIKWNFGQFSLCCCFPYRTSHSAWDELWARRNSNF